MTGPERGFLLLCSHLGDPERRPLTPAQFRLLGQRTRNSGSASPSRELELSDLTALGYSQEDAGRILALLEEDARLDRYLKKGADNGCIPLTRISEGYPGILRKRLMDDAPGCIWCKGPSEVLIKPAVALVGSRDLRPGNEAFAREAGFQAARQGFGLVSGNARGADRSAQDACLKAGGTVISVLPDELIRHTPAPGQLLLCEDSFDLEFTRIRALRRNRIIHALGRCVLVAQSSMEKGGTWDGTERNLRGGWSPVYCFSDGSDSARALETMGASLIQTGDLCALEKLATPPATLFDM